MSIGVIVDFRFKAGTQGPALMTEAMKKRLPSTTRSYDGCEYVHLYVDPDDANRLVLLERWESLEKYEKYREYAMSQSETGDLLSTLESEPIYTYLDDTGA